MRNRKIAVILSVLALVIGFASVTTTLVLNGTIAFGENDDFEIIFTEVKLDNIRKNSLISEDKKAISFETKELSSLEDKSTLEYTVSNTSRNYDANIEVDCHINEGDEVNSNSNIDITYKPKSMLIEAGQSKNGTIEIKLVKVLTEPEDINLKCELIATPVERESLGTTFKHAGTLKATTQNNTSDFWQYKESIRKVVFENTLSPKGTDLSWDVSEEQDGSVMSYLVVEELSEEESNSILESVFGMPIDDYKKLLMEHGYTESQAVLSIAEMKNQISSLSEEEKNYYFEIYVYEETGMSLEEYKKNIMQEEGITEEEFNLQIEQMKDELFPEPSETYILYIQSEGFIYANADSSYLFSNFAYLMQIEGLEYFDTSNVTAMRRMFSGCSALISLNLSSFDTSNVTDMNSMFASYQDNSGSDLLRKLDLSNFDTSKVTDMSGMFFGRSNLIELDLSSFDTSNVTNMRVMFFQCYQLTNLNLSSFDTSNVVDMGSMFFECYRLTSLNLSSFDTSEVTNMASMFHHCHDLINLDLSSFDIRNVTDMGYMFYSMPANAIVKVKDEEVQKWVLTNKDSRPSSWTTENVIIKV